MRLSLAISCRLRSGLKTRNEGCCVASRSFLSYGS